MPRLTDSDPEVRSRFSGWLAATMDAHGVKKRPLAIAIQTYNKPGSDALSAPRNLVAGWKAGLRSIGAGRAFAVGEALRKLGVPHSSGPVALFVSGRFTVLVEILGRLAQDPNGRWPALALYCALPEWLNRLPFEGDPAYPQPGDWDDKFFVGLRELCQTAVDDADGLLRRVFEEVNGGRGCDPIVKKAILAAKPEDGISVELAQSIAWLILVPWARNLYVDLGGKNMPPFQWLFAKPLDRGPTTFAQIMGFDIEPLLAIRPKPGQKGA